MIWLAEWLCKSQLKYIKGLQQQCYPGICASRVAPSACCIKVYFIFLHNMITIIMLPLLLLLGGGDGWNFLASATSVIASSSSTTCTNCLCNLEASHSACSKEKYIGLKCYDFIRKVDSRDKTCFGLADTQGLDKVTPFGIHMNRTDCCSSWVEILPTTELTEIGWVAKPVGRTGGSV
jgi:hypothetical protein